MKTAMQVLVVLTLMGLMAGCKTYSKKVDMATGIYRYTDGSYSAFDDVPPGAKEIFWKKIDRILRDVRLAKRSPKAKAVIRDWQRYAYELSRLYLGLDGRVHGTKHTWSDLEKAVRDEEGIVEDVADTFCALAHQARSVRARTAFAARASEFGGYMVDAITGKPGPGYCEIEADVDTLPGAASVAPG